MLKQKVIKELEKKEFPNLKFLYSNEVLDNAKDILVEFLNEEKEQFRKDLELDNKDIDFSIFVRKSNLYDFWSYISHLSGVNDSEKTREIEDFILPKLTEF
jgi:Zn-dependent oligopeptidase